MNFGTAWWVKPLILIVLLAGSFGAGMVVDAHWTQKSILEQARKEREELASALTTKMAEMTDAAIKSSQVRSERERELQATLDAVIEEGQNNVTDNRACIPAGAVRSLNRLRGTAPVHSKSSPVQPAK